LKGEVLDFALKTVDLGGSLSIVTFQGLFFLNQQRDVCVRINRLEFLFGFWKHVKRNLFIGLPFDLIEEMFLATLEKLVTINMLDLGSSLLAESVHVELADKGGEVAVLKVDVKHLLGELERIFDYNRGSFVVPVNDVRELTIFQDFKGLANESRDRGFLRPSGGRFDFHGLVKHGVAW